MTAWLALERKETNLSGVLPHLTRELWPTSAYARDRLPERVLQFGSGMLLRALCVAAVDTANRAGASAGRIAVVQSTAEGASRARALNAQDGLFTLVERGLSGGAPLERIGLIGAISRTLAAESQWNVVRDVAARPEIQVIVSNVSEAGFRIDAPFPGRLTDALHARCTRAPDAPPVFVIPTELVPDNGPRLAAMVHELAGKYDRPFRDWLKTRVRFCSSLVDRIVTAPPPDQHVALEAKLGYRDALLTVTEPYALWAIEANPAIPVIVSNVSEAGFRIDAPFPTRLTDALHARFTRAPDAPPVFVIPTELVPENGPRLAAMVHELAGKYDQPFRDWLKARVRFCSSLVDRIVTAPAPDQQMELEATLGYRDALLTVTEPYALWAIEADPAELRTVFPIESASVVFAPDISFYRERKLRLLNAVHTATAPVALLAGIRTVREAIAHQVLGAFQKRLLFDEIIPATDLPADQARAFANQVLERFANPWLEHEYRVIATNQEEKFRIRVVPLIVRRRAPGLSLAAAAHLTFTRASLETLGEAARIPEFVTTTERWMAILARDGALAAVRDSLKRPP